MKKKKQLFWQLFPSYLFITLVSLFAIGWFASNSMRHFYIDHIAVDLEARTRLLKKQMAHRLSPLDATQINLICKEIGRSLSTRITVILPSGKVVGDSEEEPERMDNHADRPEIIKAFTGHVGNAIRYSSTLQQNMMYVATPLVQGNQMVAVLRASIPVTSIDNELKSIQIKMVLGGVLIALFAALISLFVSRRISRPIEKMKQGAKRFASGDLTYRLPAPDSDEMGSLAEAMNQMASQLNDRLNTIIQQHNELKAVLASMVEGVIAMDKDERIISINNAAGKMFETTPSESLGRNIQEVIRDTEMRHFMSNTLSSEDTIEGDINLNGHYERVLHAHSTSLCDAEDIRIGTLVVLNDVTRLRSLENMYRDFASNVAHEIKTPLTAIKGFVENIYHGEVDRPEETKRFLGIIIKHVNRLNSVVEDLLSLARIEQMDTTKEVKLEEGRIKDVIQTAIQVCQAKAEAKKVKIDLMCNGEVSTKIDPLLLEQAVVNLLDNAIKYSRKKSTIQVEAEVQDKEIIIRFQDHGMGIPSEHLPRIFKRFYRVDKARSRKLGGTGLGLAIVKHILQAHEGHVTVESTPGEGSTFAIHIPKS